MVIMMSSGRISRYKEKAKADMIRCNRRQIRCPSRKCKLVSWIDPDSDNWRITCSGAVSCWNKMDKIIMTKEMPADKIIMTKEIPADKIIMTKEMPTDKIIMTKEMPGDKIIMTKEMPVVARTRIPR